MRFVRVEYVFCQNNTKWHELSFHTLIVLVLQIMEICKQTVKSLAPWPANDRLSAQLFSFHLFMLEFLRCIFGEMDGG